MRNLLFIFILAIGCLSNTGEKPTSEKDSTAVPALADSAETANVKIADTATKLFKGAWFDIKYPANFIAKPSLISATNKEGYESAFFTSPDGEVVFYVFSPLWNGKATDIALKTGEKLISQDSSISKTEQKKIKNWTIEANDKSYRRSYQEIKMDENINWIFGFKYKDDAAYNKYKEQYLRFKNSIKQYAD